MEIALVLVVGVVGLVAVGMFGAMRYYRSDAQFWRGMYRAEVKYQEEEANAA